MKTLTTVFLCLAAFAIGSFFAAEARAGFGPPAALSATADDVLFAGGATHSIDFVWDNAQRPQVNLLASSINETDISVNGPRGTLHVLSVVRAPDLNAPQITATYTVEAPSGSWDIGDNGNYVVDIVGGEVRLEPAAIFVPAQPGITSFNVNIVPEPASLVLLGLSGLALFARRRRALRQLASKLQPNPISTYGD